MAKRYLILLLLFFTLPAYSQVVVQFVPEVYGRNINGLFQCQLLNPGKAQKVNLTITVTEKALGTVCVVTLPSFNLNPGNNILPFSAAKSASIQFANNNVGQLLKGNQTFPEGDYDYCFDIKASLSDIAEEQCFSYSLAPLAEFNLIDPANGDNICDTKPIMTWQPLVPAIPGSYYQLVLAEIKSGQTPIEALNYNLAIVNQSQIVAPLLPYPSIAPELQQGKRYAWQVTAYLGGTILNRSELWSFTVDCLDSVKKVTSNGYRSITDLMRGNNYIALGELRFSLTNPYQSQALNYQITQINNPDKKIRRLPKVTLKTGSNQVVINLQDTGNFKDGQYYVLQVWLSNGTSQSLRFLYEEPQ